MKNFEMPKMNISIFSEENIVTDSTATTNANVAAAKEALTGVADTTTVTTISDWMNA